MESLMACKQQFYLLLNIDWYKSDSLQFWGGMLLNVINDDVFNRFMWSCDHVTICQSTTQKYLSLMQSFAYFNQIRLVTLSGAYFIGNGSSHQNIINWSNSLYAAEKMMPLGMLYFSDLCDHHLEVLFCHPSMDKVSLQLIIISSVLKSTQ
jgi:hypothetical protein